MNKYYSSRIPNYRWLFLTLILFSLQSKALTQDSVQISINAVNKPIEVVFKQIENQTGYTFYYGKPTLNGDEVVTVQVQRSSLSSVMNVLLKGRNIAWAVKDKSIILTRRAVSENTNAAALDTVPKVSISGSIVDKSGAPIAGATVSLKGQSMGQASDNLGQFKFANIPSNATLVISSVGYRTKQIRLGGETLMKIQLDSAITDIQKVEIVSNGYQIIAKERVTGSFYNMDNQLFNRSTGATVLDRIRDLIPGVYTTNGNPSNLLDDFTIRGTSTISASKRPLLVVDNFVYDGDPNSINPNDVESITVLRDAAAASIWGVRAGNGVIVITMKKGKLNSRPKVSFNTNFTFKEKPNLFAIPIVSSRDVIDLEKKRFYAGYYDEALMDVTYPALPEVIEILAKNRSGQITESDADGQIKLLEGHDIRNDVNRYLLQTAVAQQYALNISGGGSSYQYYGSFGYDRDRPVDINSINERFTLRFSNTWQPIKALQIKAEMNWGQSKNTNRSSLGYQQILSGPYQRLADEAGNALAIPKNYRSIYVDTVKFPGQLDWHYRPLQEAENGNLSARSYNTRINVGISYTLIKGLKLEAYYQLQKTMSDETRISSLDTFFTRDLINSFLYKNSNGLPGYPYPLGGIYDKSGADQKAWNIRGQASFDRSFGVHGITAIAGLENSEFNTETWTMATQYGYNPQTNTFGVPQIGTWIKRPSQYIGTIAYLPTEINGFLNRFGSYFGNLAYTFNSKYILSGSGKVDQSNFFGVKANDRKVPLWSVGGAWLISQEDFYKVHWLPYLRLRATYGYNGNVNAGASPLATITYAAPASPLLVPFARITTPPNPQLRWERVRNVNFALDFASKNQRFAGNIEFYQKSGIDLISRIDIDPTSGFVNYTGNESSLQTNGFDLSLTSRNFDGAFRWQTTAVFSFQKDKVTAYSVKPSTVGSTGKVIVIGKPLNSIYSFRWAGLNPENGDAQFYLNKEIVGSTNSTKVKQDDLSYSGQTNPPIFGSLRNDLSYKNISLSFNIIYQFGHVFRRNSFGGGFGSAYVYEAWQHNDYINAWKAPGDERTTNVPGFLDNYPDNRYSVYGASDVLIEKGDHIRLQDIRLSYEMDNLAARVIPFSNCSLYIYASNIGFLWKASKYDPDTKGNLIPPMSRAIALGISMNF